MSLVKRLVLPAGLFLFFSARSATVLKFSDIQDANLFKKCNTPSVQRVFEIEDEFASLDNNREYFVNGPGKYLDLVLEYSDSLQNPQTREDIDKIPDLERNNKEPFYFGVFAALASLGWGAFRVGRYRAQKEIEGKERRA